MADPGHQWDRGLRLHGKHWGPISRVLGSPSRVRGLQDVEAGQVLYSVILGAVFHGSQNAGNVFPAGDKGRPLTLKALLPLVKGQ